MVDIAKIEKVFKESGLRNNHLLFNPDEREELEDFRFLEKNGFYPNNNNDSD